MSSSATAASYETKTVPAGDQWNIVLDGDTVHENILYDVTADGAGVSFRLYDSVTIRNIGIKGKNQAGRFIFRMGGGTTDITIDHVYTEHFDASVSDPPGGILATVNAGGKFYARGVTIKGFGDDATYFSKSDMTVTMEDSWIVNNRTGGYRGGGDYHGNNRDHVFRNCRFVCDDGIKDVSMYDGGGDRVRGFIGKHGTIEMHNCHSWIKSSADAGDNWLVVDSDTDSGPAECKLWDCEMAPESRIGRNVTMVSGNGYDPSDQAPSYAPTSAEEAASGSSSDTSVAVSTGSASSVTETSASLDGTLDDLGGASSADVVVDYRQSGASSWNTTSSKTLSSTGSFGFDVSGLSSGSDYEFRTRASADDGDTDAGTTTSFSTSSSDTSVVVSTDGATEVSTSGATLNGTLDDLGGASSADVSFEYRQTGASSWTETAGQTISSTGSFSESVGDLSADVEYEFRARGSASDGDADAGATATFTTTTTTLPNDLEIDGSSASEKVYYQITVSDQIEKGDRANGNDTVSGSTADGQVNGGIDTYDFSGEVTDVDLSGDVPVYVNGDRLDLSQFEYPNDLKIDGSSAGEKVYYQITVSDGIVKGEYANDNDTISGSTADGQVNGGIDTYDFAGEVTDVDLSADVPVYVNGDRLDTSQFEYPNDLKIDGSSASGQVEYEITVSDEIVKDDANDNDTVTGSTVVGQVNGGIDTYDFSGEVTDVDLSADVPIYVNGDRLDTSQFESAPSVDRYEVTEAGSANPHANITVEWDVSDADGDLATGLIEVYNSSGALAASEKTSISGNVHYGVDYFELKLVRDETFDVRLTVTDENGNKATAARSVTE